jgi:hypothetical protein
MPPKGSRLSQTLSTDFSEPKGQVLPRELARLRETCRDMEERAVAMQHLDQKGLAERWKRSPRTLEQWRWQGKGPQYLKIGSRVLYRLEDIERYEADHLRANTAKLQPAGRSVRQ